jgi:Flp pilus assembly pilin Flp
VEYSLIIALVAIVVIAILVLMGPQIGQIFSTITNGL